MLHRKIWQKFPTDDGINRRERQEKNGAEQRQAPEMLRFQVIILFSAVRIRKEPYFYTAYPRKRHLRTSPEE